MFFFTTQLKCHQHTERTTRKDRWNAKVVPTPSKKIGPAGQKKGKLLHVSSKYAPQIQNFCVRLLCSDFPVPRQQWPENQEGSRVSVTEFFTETEHIIFDDLLSQKSIKCNSVTYSKKTWETPYTF